MSRTDYLFELGTDRVHIIGRFRHLTVFLSPLNLLLDIAGRHFSDPYAFLARRLFLQAITKQVQQGRRLVTIGRYGVITLANAREEAKRILAEHTLGRVRPHSITYATAVELFLTDKARGRRQSTVYSYKIKLDRLNFKGQLSDITHAEASRHLDRIKAPSERSHVLSAARAFFNWCAKRRYVTDNPFFGLTKSAHKGASNSFSR